MNAKQIVWVGLLLVSMAFSSPAQIPTPGLTLWLKADAGVVREPNEAVSAWTDQSPAGLSLAQANDGLRPFWVSNVLNGLPVLRWANHYLVRPGVIASNLFAPDADTVFLVLKQDGADPYNTPLSWVAPGDTRFLVHATWADYLVLQVGVPSTAGISITQPTNWDDTWHLLQLGRADTNGEIRLDGRRLIRDGVFHSPGSTDQAADLLVGTDAYGNTFSGDIAEIVLYARTLSEPERATVEHYLAAKWGLPYPVTPQPDLVIKNAADSEAGYVGRTVLQPVPENTQTKAQSVPANTATTFQVKVFNDGSNVPVVLKAVESGGFGWSVVFRWGTTNVSSEILSSNGWSSPPMATGSSQLLTLQVSAGSVLPPGATHTITVQAYDQADHEAWDAVAAVLTTQPSSQPDLLVRLPTDPGYAGEHLYNSDGAGQTRYSEVTNGRTASYSVRLVNDGNTNASFVLTSPPPAAFWSARYYAARPTVQFDGGSSVIDTGPWSPGNRWTLEAWVKPTATWGGRRTIVGGMAECLDWSLAMHDGAFAVETRQPGGCTIGYRSSEGIVPGTWYHVAATCDGVTATLYVDGQSAASGPVDPDYPPTAQGVRIGSEVCCGGNTFPGFINEVRIWGQVRSAEEIQAAMNQELTGNEPGLAGYWRLNEGGGSVVRDLTPNGHHGTLANGAQWAVLLNETDGFDLTAQVTGGGYSIAPLPAGAGRDFLVQATPGTALPAGSTYALALQALSTLEPARLDTVKLVTSTPPLAKRPVNALYTTTADFDHGTYLGLEALSTADQLQLSPKGNTFSFLWIPNSDNGTVSKVDTLTGRELARYRVCPPEVTGNPSRTTVDQYGNCWVANRNACTVVKIGLFENGQYLDRNGDGIVQTSTDRNGDGYITDDEMLPWGQDECVLWEVSLNPGAEARYVPGTYLGSYPNDYWLGPRSMAIDAQANLWAGTHNPMKFYYLDGSSVQILRTNDLAPYDHTPYGAVIDRQGIVWSSGYKENGVQNLLRLDPRDNSMTNLTLEFHPYGLGVDRFDHLFVSGHQEGRLARFDTRTGLRDWTVAAGHRSRGVVCTDDGDIWVVNSNDGTVTRYAPGGSVRGVIAVCPEPTGVSVDPAGKVWVCGNGNDWIYRIDPATDLVDLSRRVGNGSRHYGYSDMTGIVARNTTVRVGLWTVLHDGRYPNTAWTRVLWHGSDPTGTNIIVRLRSSNDGVSWSAWETAVNGTDARATPPGQFLQIEVALHAWPDGSSPSLLDVSVQAREPAAADLAPLLTAGPEPLCHDHPFTSTLTVTNRSTAWASGILLTYLLPANVEVGAISAPGGSWQQTTGGILFRLGGVAPLGAAQVTVQLNPLTEAPLANLLWVTANETDPNPNDNTNEVVLTVQPNVCAPPLPGMVAWWAADGIPADLAGTNALTLQGGVAYAPAKAGLGFAFDSDDDRLTVPYSPDFDMTRPGFTAAFWMKANKNQPYDLVAVMEKSHGWVDYTGWAFQAFRSSGVLSFGVGVGGASSWAGADSRVDVLNDRWHHVAGTWDGFNLRLYVDGALQQTSPLLFPGANTRPLNLGFAWGGGSPQRFYRGLLDEVSLHHRALTATEIAALYDARTAGVCKSVLFLNQPFAFAEGVVGLDYRQTVSAAGGQPPYSFALSAGALPAGLGLSPDGLVSGRPTTPRLSVFTVQARDALGAAAARVFTQAVARCTPPPAGLVGWWPGDTNTDDVVNGLHGTLQNGATYQTGRVGAAFSFDGTDDAMPLPGSRVGPLDLTGQQLTLAAWINLAATNPPSTAYQVIFDKYWYYEANGYALSVINGRLVFHVAAESSHGFALTNQTDLPRQQWLHVAATYDGGTARLLVNGVEQAAAPLTGNILHCDLDACVANDNWGSRSYGFNGLLGEIQVFARALSAAELEATVAAGAAGLCAPTPLDLLVKNTADPDSTYAARNVRQLWPDSAQTKSQSVLPLCAASYTVKLVNDDASPRSFVLKALEDTNAGWTVAYSLAGRDCTPALLDPLGLTLTNLAPGEARELVLEVTPSLAVLGHAAKSVTLRGYFDGLAGTVRDAVQATTLCLPVWQPDLMVRRTDDPVFAGEGFWNSTGEGQSKALEVEAGQTATYLVQLRNYGNLTNRVSLQTTPGAAGWALRWAGDRPVLRLSHGNPIVEVSNSPSLHSDRALTIAGWFKSDVFDQTWQCLFWKGNTPDCTTSCENREYALWLNSGGYLWFTSTPTDRIGVGELNLGNASGSIRPGSWYHFATVLDCDASRMQIWINGELQAEGPYNSAGIRTSQGSLYLGGLPANWNFSGALQNLSLWNRPLGTNEIRTLRTESPAPTAPGLMAFWPLMDGLGEQVVDQSTNQNHGTIRNGARWEIEAVSSPTALDLTSALANGGRWTNLVLPPKGLYNLQLEVGPDFSLPPGASLELGLTAASLADGAADTIQTLTTLLPASSIPLGGQFTSSADFAKGRLVGVDTTTVADQLQLSAQPFTFPFLWVPNNDDSSISKVDTRTGHEVARYRTVPPGVNGQPSRTTVDLNGNCWVANRYAGTVVKVGLFENGQYLDRNGNGLIDTSSDRNGDGVITDDEVLPWGQDECVLFEVMLDPGQERAYLPGTYTGSYYNSWGYPGPRGLAVDASNHLWCGTFDTRMFYRLDGASGQILRALDVSSANQTTYGAVIDPAGIVWAASNDKNQVFRLDTHTGEFSVIPVGHFTYGITVDRSNHIFVTGWQNSRLTRLNSRTATVDYSAPGAYESRGVCVTTNGDVWTANSSPGTVTRWSSEGVLKATIPVGPTPTGVAVDAAGQVWVVGLGDSIVRRINPDLNQVEFSRAVGVGAHYGYSDMTGMIARNATTRIGAWNRVHDARVLNTPWGLVFWTAAEPEGTAVRVRVRSSNNRQVWSLWEEVVNHVALHATPPGQYLELEVNLQSLVPGRTPVLYDLTVRPATEANYGVLVYSNDFTGALGSEWSATATGVTPTGARPFLGTFGNQTVTLSLSNLPPHAAATVAFDQFVIGPWAGNDSVAGPDLFELNLGGGLRLLHATLNNGPSNALASGQSYPLGYPGGSYPAHFGAAETNTLGFPGPDGPVMDTVYRHLYSFPHTADALTLNFLATGLSGDALLESWALAHVRVFITPRQAAPRLLRPTLTPEGWFSTQLENEPGWLYTLQTSEDLRTWTNLWTNRTAINLLPILDTNAPSAPARFYRVLQEP